MEIESRLLPYRRPSSVIPYELSDNRLEVALENSIAEWLTALPCQSALPNRVALRSGSNERSYGNGTLPVYKAF